MPELRVGVCCSCGGPSNLLCDGKVINGKRVPLKELNSGAKAATCDAPLCRACAKLVTRYHARTSKGCQWNSIDLCPQCAAVNQEEGSKECVNSTRTTRRCL